MSPIDEYQNGTYVFHSTWSENVDSILEQGIRCDAGVGHTSSDVLRALERLECDDPFPFNRRHVTYCSIDPKCLEREAEELETDYRERSKAYIVVNPDAIPNDMYLADMDIATELLQYPYRGERAFISGETLEEVVNQYAKSIVKVQSTSDFQEYMESIALPELVVVGNIPPEAIVTVL